MYTFAITAEFSPGGACLRTCVNAADFMLYRTFVAFVYALAPAVLADSCASRTLRTPHCRASCCTARAALSVPHGCTAAAVDAGYAARTSCCYFFRLLYVFHAALWRVYNSTLDARRATAGLPFMTAAQNCFAQ